MPLKNYSVLRGDVIKFHGDDPAHDNSPHYEISVTNGFKIAFNVQSVINPHDLLYLYKTIDDKTLIDALNALPVGITTIATHGHNQYPQLKDYVDYTKMFKRSEFKVIEYVDGNPNDQNQDLRDILHGLLTQARSNKHSVELYAFGEAFPHGIHDIHMNQGNGGRFGRDDGPNQDGALILNINGTWHGLFTAFQSQKPQAWAHENTHLLSSKPPGPHNPTVVHPHGSQHMKVVGAVLEAGKGKGHQGSQKESVVLLNKNAHDKVDLQGWTLRDDLGRKHDLHGHVDPLHSLVVPLTGQGRPYMNNHHGIIQLLDNAHAVVDEVTYKASDVAPEGNATLF